MRRLLAVGLVLAAVAAAPAHDIWIEPSVNLIRTGDWLQLSLMLGNHGNHHRDFRLASKVGAGDTNLTVYGPEGFRLDLTKSLVDNGLAPEEGFWSARFQPSAAGLYMAASRMDKVMSYAPVRDVKSAKTFFAVSRSLDEAPASDSAFERVLGHPLEIVPLIDPVASLRPGGVLRVRVLYKGKPLAGNRISFVPRGAKPQGEVDPRFETTTDARGGGGADASGGELLSHRDPQDGFSGEGEGVPVDRLQRHALRGGVGGALIFRVAAWGSSVRKALRSHPSFLRGPTASTRRYAP